MEEEKVIRTMLLTAALTGLFCSAFAVFVHFMTSALGLFALVLVSFTSGFLGSFFAQSVLGRVWERGSVMSRVGKPKTSAGAANR